MKDEELESIITKVSDLSHGEIDPSDSQIRNLLSGNLEGP